MTKLADEQPWTHGIEIEQFPADTNVGPESNAYFGDDMRGGMPTGVIRDSDIGGWERDGSGPQETDIGPVKNVKTVLNQFFRDTREKGYTWDWHAADPDGHGAGSHAHLCLDESKITPGERIPAWTIAYNTAVDIVPFLAPFWCHNWQEGFRNGSGDITTWAASQTVRASQSSVRSMVDGIGSQPGAGEYPSVRANAPRDDFDDQKPFTVEIRLNDGFPAMACMGLLHLRVIASRAIERGESPKIENRGVLREVYRKIKSRAESVGLMAAMKEELSEPIRFVEGRGIPGVKQMEFDTAADVLNAILKTDARSGENWRARCHNLVATLDDRCSPHRNIDALWRIDAPAGEFAWTFGPADLEHERLQNFEKSAYDDTTIEQRAAACVEFGDGTSAEALIAEMEQEAEPAVAADGGQNTEDEGLDQLFG